MDKFKRLTFYFFLMCLIFSCKKIMNHEMEPLGILYLTHNSVFIRYIYIGDGYEDFGICYSETNENPTIEDSTVSYPCFSNKDGEYVTPISGLKPNTTYYVRVYGNYNELNPHGIGKYHYSKTISFKTLTPEYLTDSRDGKKYPVVTIGKQKWMAANLDYKTKFSRQNQYDSINTGRYGQYYTWYEACNVCPDGWKLPSDNDWLELEHYIGMHDTLLFEFGGHNRSADGIIKLLEPPGLSWRGTNLFTNETGLSIMASGYYEKNYDRWSLGTSAMFWSSTVNDTVIAYSDDEPFVSDTTLAYTREFELVPFDSIVRIKRYVYSKRNYYLPVRCVKTELD